MTKKKRPEKKKPAEELKEPMLDTFTPSTRHKTSTPSLPAKDVKKIKKKESKLNGFYEDGKNDKPPSKYNNNNNNKDDSNLTI